MSIDSCKALTGVLLAGNCCIPMMSSFFTEFTSTLTPDNMNTPSGNPNGAREATSEDTLAIKMFCPTENEKQCLPFLRRQTWIIMRNVHKVGRSVWTCRSIYNVSLVWPVLFIAKEPRNSPSQPRGLQSMWLSFSECGKHSCNCREIRRTSEG